MDTRELLLLSWFVGDGFGSQTDGMDESEIETLAIDSIDEVYTLEEIQPLCGQSGPASDLSILAGLSLIALGQIDLDHVRSKYRTYEKESGAFSFPQKGDNALSLTRAPIMALLDERYPYTKWEAIARSETQITHSSSLAIEALLLVSRAFVLLMHEEADEAHQLAALLIKEVSKRGWSERLSVALRTAVNQKPLAEGSTKESYQIITTITTVFHTLLSGLPYEAGLESIARRGGNSRLSGAIYSSLKSLVDGQAPPERFSAEIYPSPTLEAMIKSETLFRRETIKMENLAERIARDLAT
ncbi:MAG: ADP-ribosylglycohydrolase family protein [Sphaerochaeta sp.]|jgi:hypothetical protein|nr:ADP-ribosylglycohydrolase family protein [Sphaerochaeta sp.]